MSKCLWTFIWVTYFLFFCLFLKVQIKILFQNNHNKHAHELWTDGHVDALILYSSDYMSKPKRTAGAILLLRLVKYNDISVFSGFLNVCVAENRLRGTCGVRSAVGLLRLHDWWVTEPLAQASTAAVDDASALPSPALTTLHKWEKWGSMCAQWHATFTRMFRIY